MGPPLSTLPPAWCAPSVVCPQHLAYSQLGGPLAVQPAPSMVGSLRQGLTAPPNSVLKDHCVQHLPDGSVTVESILIQAAAHSEDPSTKVLLVSWTYQVRSMAVEPLLVLLPAWAEPQASVPLQDEELGSYLTALLKKGLPQVPS